MGVAVVLQLDFMDAVKVLQELVRAPSIYGEEHGATAIIERELQCLEVEVTAAPFDANALQRLPGAQRPFCMAPDRKNLIARIPGRGSGRSIILNCHLDVVPAGDRRAWSVDPFGGAIIDGAVYGRGANDDKAGAAILLLILKEARAARLGGDVIGHFVLEDETTGNGTLLCLDRELGAHAAIIIDGTRGDRGINQHAGNLKFRLTVFGSPASVSVSHMGINAAELLAEISLAMKTRVAALNASAQEPWTQFPSPNQLSMIAIDCDEMALTVPALATATFYATFTPPHTEASFLELLQSTAREISSRCRAPDPQAEVLFLTEPVRSDAGEIEKAIGQAAKRPIPFGPSTGTSDLRHFAARDIPCVLYGPGRGHNPHRPDEHFEIASLAETAELLTAVVCDWCR